MIMINYFQYMDLVEYLPMKKKLIIVLILILTKMILI